MKFRNPKTGEIFDVSFGVAWTGFCYGINCSDCPIRMGPLYCKKFVHDHPHEAARLMGYEVVEDDHIPQMEKKEANMDNPRICEVLGVEVGEWFTYPGMSTSFQVTENGFLRCADGDLKMCVPTLINHPDRIIRKPRFTQQEVEDAKTLKRLFGEYKIADFGARHVFGGLRLNEDAFPSIQPGQFYTLDEIIGGTK